MNDKPFNNRAWLFVLPVLGFVLFSSIIPMMTVVNYSVQDSMGQNSFFWAGRSGSPTCSTRRPISAAGSAGRWCATWCSPAWCC